MPKMFPSIKKSRGMAGIVVPVGALCIMLSIAVHTMAQNDTSFAIVSRNGDYWKNAAVTTGGGNATVTVNANDTKQKWYGFAGTFNEAGWDALKVLSEADRTKAINLLFDKKDGIGFGWGRIPIGASDYALDRYSLCDGSGDDFNMTRFSIERDKGCLIQYIKAAQAVKSDIKFWASPWTPPPWMKKDAFDAAGFDGGEMRNETNVLGALALYFSKFIEEYGKEGIPISAVCPQNEPGYTRSYPTCGWGAYNYDNGKGSSGDKNGAEYLSTFVASHLYPKLQADHPETEIWFGTLSNDATSAGYWNGMKGKATSGMIKGLGLQWNNVSMVSSNVNNYFVFCSEHQCGNYYWTTKVTSVEQADSTHFLADRAPNNFSYGVESWGLIKKWLEQGSHMYSAWNMVLDTKGINLNTALEWPQNALLVVDRNAKTLTATPYYYVMRHISQYVDNTGAVRVGTSGSPSLAFKNANGGIVTIVYNAGGQTQMTVAVNGTNYQFTHPGQGWATLYVGPKPVQANRDGIRSAAAKTANDLKVTCIQNGYRVTVPSEKAGRIELLTLTGRVLLSRAIAQGSSELVLPMQEARSGMLLVRAVFGNEVTTARLFTAQ